MYTTILTYSLRGEFDLDKNIRMRDLFYRIINSIIVLFDRISPTGLAMILDEPKTKIISMLNYLHSVLDVPKRKNKLIRLLHPSFRDFLLNPERYSNTTFLINIKNTHRHLFDCCLKIISKHLRRNIYNL